MELRPAREPSFVDLSTALTPAARTCNLESPRGTSVVGCSGLFCSSRSSFRKVPSPLSNLAKQKESRIVPFSLYYFISKAFILMGIHKGFKAAPGQYIFVSH